MVLAVATGEPSRMRFLRKSFKDWALLLSFGFDLIGVLKMNVIVFVMNRVTEESTTVVAVEKEGGEGEATDANKETLVEAQAEKEPEDKVHFPFPSLELVKENVTLMV